MHSNLLKKVPKVIRVFAAGIGSAGLILMGMPGMPVMAAGDIEMSTDYPGIYTKPGQSLTFSLDFNNTGDSGEIVELSESSLPDGWDGEFEGSGSTISSVYVKAGENDSLVTYAITVPDDAQKGSYDIVLKGDSASLTLTVNVTDQDVGTSGLTADQEEQEGPTGTTFTYSATLQNASAQDQTYTLNADAPTGWNVTFTPSGDSNAAASVTVGAHASETLSVRIVPPDTVSAGEYEIPISAVSGDENLSATLKVNITGTYGLSFATTDGTVSFDANPKQEKDVQLTVTNTGNIDLKDISLSASAPTDWTAEFSEDTIDSLAAGESKTVTMKVTPSENAISGDYQMNVTVSSAETSQTNTFRVTVKTSTTWGIVGVVIIVAIIAALAGIFHKFGRH